MAPDTEMPFEMWIGTATSPMVQVMRTADYDFAKKSTVRRIISRLVPKIEAPDQPTHGEVRVGGDVLFALTRIVKQLPSGKKAVYFRLSKDWQYEDSPVLNKDILIEEF